MKNIAIIIPNLKGGGAERVASLLSEGLSNSYNIYMVLFNSEDMAYSYSGKLIDIKVKPNSNYFMKLINVINRVYLVREFKKENNINCSISLLATANIVNVLSRINKSEKIIVSIHSSVATSNTGLGRINKLLFSKADKVVGVSKYISKDLINNFSLRDTKVNTIYNPINFKHIEEQLKEKTQDTINDKRENFTIVNMGRLSNAKGQWHLIRALSYVKKHITDVKLLILGQGELEEYLKKLVKELGLTKNVVFLGHQQNPFKYIAKSDLFVLSSLYEGFGNAIIEAMACDVPVISTDCKSGPREILAPTTDIEYKTNSIEYSEYGVLVPVCDGKYYNSDNPLTKEEKMLAQGIINLYNDSNLREQYAFKGKKRAMDFDLSNIINNWENIINNSNY